MGRLTEAVEACPAPSEQLSPGVLGEWSELQSLAIKLAVGTSEVGDADGGADLSSSMIVGAAGGEATLCACRTAGRSWRRSVSRLSVAARIAR